MTNHQIFHLQGYTAYLSGQWIDECPYTKDTSEYFSWISGWYEAEQLELDRLDRIMNELEKYA